MKFNFFFIIFLLYFNSLSANNDIVFIDLNYISQNSLVGKEIISLTKKKEDILINEFLKIENELKSEEDKVFKQKNVLSEDEYKIKTNELRVKIEQYKELRLKKNNELNLFRIEAKKELLSLIDPIISDYSKKNSISLILQKKDVVIGRTDLDITKKIFDELNKRNKKIKLK